MCIADAHLADLQQIIDGLLVALLFEEMTERAGYFATDVRHALEQRPRQMADQLQIAKPLRQHLGRAFADVFDAQCEQQAFERGSTTSVDRRDQVVSPLGGDLLRVPFKAGRLHQCLRAPARIIAVQLEHGIEHRAAAFGRQMQLPVRQPMPKDLRHPAPASGAAAGHG